jgi:hypothetical protein
MDLQEYVHGIPAKVGAIGMRSSVDAANRLMPNGIYFPHVIANLNKYVPVAIDDNLNKLKECCSKLYDPYASHILAEIATILTLLQNFRSAHTPQTVEAMAEDDLWERNYGMESMDFFAGQCFQCLQYVTDLHWDSEWCKDAFEAFQGECVTLKAQLETAKLTEVGLKGWKKTLIDARDELNVACNAVRGMLDDYTRLNGINKTLNKCENVIKEMLRILNPAEPSYKMWYLPQDREQFLKDIGFLSGMLQPTGEMQTLLAQMKKLSA